ncbi:hypothetical protein Tco_1156014 [Tanacetum coccineum]
MKNPRTLFSGAEKKTEERNNQTHSFVVLYNSGGGVEMVVCGEDGVGVGECDVVTVVACGGRKPVGAAPER